MGEERAFLKDIEKLTRMSIPVAALPAGVSAGVEPQEASKAPARRGRQQSRRDQQPRGEKRAAGNPGREQHRGGNRSDERSGQQRPEGSRSKNRGGRQERSAGLDMATGLPAFLTRPQKRSERSVEA
jgi:ATP-dependent RNA helicase RhlE